MKPPILVTGAHRSGTTWVGRMLCAGGGVRYVQEPFNAGVSGPTWLRERVPYWYYYATAADKERLRGQLEDLLAGRYPVVAGMSRIRKPRHVARLCRDFSVGMLSRLQQRRTLLKDPLALFSAEWLSDEFGMQVIVMIRRPVAFVSSLKHLGWGFDFRGWVSQPILMEELLAPYSAEIEYMVEEKRGLVDQAILLWNILYSIVCQYRNIHSDWTFVEHEPLARDPLTGFQRLYEKCGLGWSPRARQRILAHSNAYQGRSLDYKPGEIRRNSSATLKTWRERLSDDEIERVRRGTASVASKLYATEG